MNRPGFKRGLGPSISVKSRPIDIKNNRRGIGNFAIQRPGAKQSNPIPRIVKFDAFQTFDINNAGVVELGEKTLKKLLEVKIPDEMDKLWLAEKARLTTIYQAQGMSPEDIKNELLLNKPLGREQRYNIKMASLGDAKLSFSNKLSELKDEVRIGNTLSQTERATLSAQLANVLNNTLALSSVSQLDMKNIVDILKSVRIPDDRQNFGIIPRFVDKNYYDTHSGAINMLAINKVRVKGESKGYSYSEPFKDFSVNSTGVPAKSIIQMYRKLERKYKDRSFLDLDTCSVLSKKQMMSVISTTKDDINTNPLYSIGLIDEVKPGVMSTLTGLLPGKTTKPVPTIIPTVIPPTTFSTP